MKLDKSDALMLHSVLFAYVNSNVNLDFVDVEHLQSLQERLVDFVAFDHEECQDCEGSNHSDEDDTTDDVDEDEEDEEDEFEDEEEDLEEEEDDEEPIDTYVSAKDAAELLPIKVLSPDGSTVTLEFEDVGDEDAVDALVDEGTVIIDSVVKVVIDEKCVSLNDGEGWHDFKVVKLSKSWKRVFPSGKIVGFSGGE